MYTSPRRRISTSISAVCLLLVSACFFESASAQILVEDFSSSNTFGGFGTGDGQFDNPNGIAVDPLTGDIWVSDTNNHRLQKFDADGNFLMSVGSQGDGPGEFSSPQGLAIDNVGNIYVAESGNSRITELFSDGTFFRYIGSSDPLDGGLISPFDVTLDPSGNIIVSNTFCDRLEIFNSFGVHQGSAGVGILSTPTGAAFDDQGNLFVTEFTNGTIKKFDASYNLLGSFGGFGETGSGPGEFQGAVDVAFNLNSLFINDMGNGRIQQLDTDGNFLSSFGSAGPGNGQFGLPFALVFDTDGNLLVAEASNSRIQKLAPPNLPPLLVDDGKTIPEDGADLIDILNNDDGVTDDLDISTLTITGQPSNGTVDTDPQFLGQVLYVPNGDFHGTDTFTYTIKDQAGQDPINGDATVTVTVTPVNDPPFISANNPPSVPNNGFKTLVPLDLDTIDPDNPPSDILFFIDILFDNGTLFNSDNPGTPLGQGDSFTNQNIIDGKISYQHDGSNTTSDQTTLTFTDNLAPGTQFTFSVNILDPVPPTAGNGSFSTPEDQTLSISNDVFEGLSEQGSRPIDPGTVNITNQPSNGTAQIVGNNLEYTPAPDFNGSVTFTYNISDNQGLPSDDATITVEIEPTPDVLKANDDAVEADEDVSLTFNPLANDEDVDNPGDPVAPDQLDLVDLPSNGTATVNNASQITFTPDVNFNGTAQFTYTITDERGTSNQATVSITVNPVNDPPVQEGANQFSGLAQNSDTPFTENELNATDVDDPDNQLQYQIKSLPNHGSLELGGLLVQLNDIFTQGDILANNLRYINNGTGETSDQFTYDLTDGFATLRDLLFTITLLPNQPPVANNDVVEIDEDDLTLPLNLIFNDTDPDGQIDPSTVTITRHPDNGIIIPQEEGGLIYDPDDNFHGQDFFLYTVKDDNGAVSNVATVTITVLPVNDSPRAEDDNFNIQEDAPATGFNILANDSDIDGNLDPSSVVVKFPPEHGTLTIDGVTGAATYTPNQDFNGLDGFDYEVSDITGFVSNTASVSIDVAPVNDPPVQTGTNSLPNVVPGSGVTVTSNEINASDVDNTNDQLQYQVKSLPNHGSLELGGLLMQLNDIFTQGDILANNLRYINDGTGETSDQFTYDLNDGFAPFQNFQFNININQVMPPTAANDAITIIEDEEVDIPVAQFLNNDTKGTFPLDGVFVDLIVNPGENGIDNVEAISAFDQITNTFFSFVRITLTKDFNGQGSFTYRALDSRGNRSNTATVTVNVTSVDDPPEQAGTNNLSDVAPGSETKFTNTELNTNDVDNNPADAEYRITALPSHGTLTFNQLVLQLDDIFRQVDVDDCKVRYINDGNGATNDQWGYAFSNGGSTPENHLFNIDLNPVTPPTAVNDEFTFEEDKDQGLNGLSLIQNDVQGTFPFDLFEFGAGNPGAGIFDLRVLGGIGASSIQIQFEKDFHGTTSFSYAVTDINGNVSNEATVTITVTPVNDVPEVEIEISPLEFQENDGPKPIVPDLELKDPDGDTQMVGATIQITGNYRIGEDVLNLANPPSDILVSFDIATGTLTLNGVASIEVYQALLRTVTYNNTFDNPNEEERTITFTVDDGVFSSQAPIPFEPSDPVARVINIIAVNDVPTVEVNNPLTVDHSTSDVITAALLRVDDPDHDPDERPYVITSLPESGDLLLNGVLLDQNDTFTQDDVDADLMTYQHNGNLATEDAFTFDVSDGEDTVSGQMFQITINAPVFTTGDTNGDDRVDIRDAVGLVSSLIGRDPAPPPQTVAFLRADSNGDGLINVLDIIRIINIILNVDTPPGKAVASTPVRVSLSSAEAQGDRQLMVPLNLDSAEPIAGLQAEISFDPSRMSIGKLRLTDRAEGLTVETHLDGDILRILMYGAAGQTISDGSEAVLYLPVSLHDGESDFPTKVRINHIVLADARAQSVTVQMTQASIAVRTLPTAFALRHAYPNPFNPATTIAYDVPEQAHITLIIYNLLGQEVIRLVDQVQQPGRYEFTWNARNAQGRGVASGVYLYRLVSSTGFVDAERMTLLK